MISEKERGVVDKLSKLLLDILILSKPPGMPAEYASIDSFQALHTNLISLREFLLAASSGDLSKQLPFKGFIAGTIKTLQANLRHITWQTKMVASGDFTQRVDFMGEFSKSFNAMVIQLDQTLKELERKEAALSQANEELLKENAIRKQTETALRESEKALMLQATTDSLTGLYNRRHFLKLAETEINKSLRYSRPLSVIMYDIDFFKRINDSYGHPAGDKVIQMVAGLTQKELRTGDIPARYGGEEFIVLLPETPQKKAAIVAERIRKKIEMAIIQIDKQTIAVTASFGVSDHFENTNAKSNNKILTEYISKVDQALYTSKDSGRNRVTVFEA